MMTRKYLTILRDIIIAAMCTVWLLPLWIGERIALDALAWWEDHQASAANISWDGYPFGSVSAFTVASFFLSIAILLLGVTIFCLVFVWLRGAERDQSKDTRQTPA